MFVSYRASEVDKVAFGVRLVHCLIAPLIFSKFGYASALDEGCKCTDGCQTQAFSRPSVQTKIALKAKERLVIFGQTLKLKECLRITLNALKSFAAYVLWLIPIQSSS